MSLRRRSVLLRVALLVLVPLTFLIALSVYTITTSVSSALTLTRSKVVMDNLAGPVTSLQQALTRERAEVLVYATLPSPAAQVALQQQQAATDRAVASFTAAAGSQSVQRSASADGKKAIGALREAMSGLPSLRAGITHGSLSGQQVFTDYNDMIGASYQVLEQAIIQEGNSTQVLPGIAVIELAVSNEYLQQESALLNGDFAAHAFPASAHQAFVRLVGAHRLLYEQSYSYLDPADRGYLDHDVSPRAANSLTALENRLVATGSVRGGPPVHAATWNSLVATRQRADPARREPGRGRPRGGGPRAGQQQAARTLSGRRPGAGRGHRLDGPVPVDRRQPGPAAARPPRLGPGPGPGPAARRGAATARRRRRGRDASRCRCWTRA